MNLITSNRHATSARATPAHLHVHADRNRVVVLDLIRTLCERLNACDVHYVHWKSNINLDRALDGRDDLDLLVTRRDANALLEVLFHLGFREAIGTSPAPLGIRHFYAWDPQSSQFIHVHLHFRLPIGHDATKNYHLPLEEAMIDSRSGQQLLPVPASEFELVLYVLRMVLKFTITRSPLRRSDRTGENAELERLEEMAKRERIDDLLQRHLPCIDRELFDACWSSVRPGKSRWRRYRVQRRLHAALAAHGRQPRLVDGGLIAMRQRLQSLSKRLRRLQQRLRRRRSRRQTCQRQGKRLVRGGTVVAILGGDGAGKSTVVGELHQRFGQVFATDKLHLGKPNRSWLTKMVDRVIKLDRACRKRLSLPARPTPGQTEGSPDLLSAARLVCTARDRYRTAQQARRWAARGGVAICDRWPLVWLKRMDSPKITNVATAMGVRGKLLRVLQAKEARYHRDILPPDVLIVLRVDPDVAVARRSDESEAMVRPRSQEVWQFDWQGTTAHVIDAGRPLQEVVTEATTACWERI